VTPVVFLPGIIAPAAFRYAALLAELPGVDGVLKDLEVYRGGEPPADYTITAEVEGLHRTADDAGVDRFDIYCHSGGRALRCRNG
jgi:hypothetical protein